MANIVIPTGYTLYSATADSVTLYRSDSTVAQPHFMVIDRKVPAYDGSKYTVADWRLRVFRGTVDSLGAPVPVKASATLEFRWQPGQDAEIDTILADLKLVVADTNLLSAIKGLMIPNCCS